jgi:hypothetical protein
VVAGLLLKDPNLPILFFSPGDYEQATQGLTESEIDIALKQRLKSWSPQALDHALGWIVLDERRSLTLTARAAHGASAPAAALLDTHFVLALDLLTSIVGTGRYDEEDYPNLISAAVEKDVMLMTELGNSSETTTRGEFAKSLAQELTRHGQREFAEALPYLEPARGVWVVPFDDAVRGYLKVREEPGVEWRGGVVASLSEPAIRNFQKDGKKVEILYPDGGNLTEDFANLSRPQLFLRFAKRSGADEATKARRMADYLNLLRLDVTLLRRALLKRAVKEDVVMVPLLERQIQAETSILASHLVKAGSWITAEDHEAPLATLRVAEEQVSADAAFFAGLALRRRNEAIARRMKAIVETKRADLTRVADAANRLG